MNEITYVRDCPKCGKKIKTKNKYWHKSAVKKKTSCGSCSLKGRKFSEAHKQKLSENHANVNGENNPFYKKKHSQETLKKLSEFQINRLKDNDYRNKLSNSMKEYHKYNDNAFKNKTHTDETKAHLSTLSIKRFENQDERDKISVKVKKWYETNDSPFKGKFHTNENKLKMSNSHKEYLQCNEHSWTGRAHTNESKKQMRLSAIKRISKAKFNGGQVNPNYNISSILILEAKAMELGITDLQHAENGGEYHIKELGYFVDGYSKEKNIVIEYDENHHFTNGKLRKKDIQRQIEIEEYLKCKFIRVNEIQ